MIFICYSILGNVHRQEHVDMLRRVHMFKPDLFPNAVVNAIKPDRRLDEFDAVVDPSVWDTTTRDEPKEPVIFEIFGHIDGVAIFKNSAQASVKPILNKITAVRNSKCRVKLPAYSPVFLTGMFHGKNEDIDDLCDDYFNELLDLKWDNPRKADSPILVELRCMICDAPQRADCKATSRWNGYQPCERCKQQGEIVDRVMTIPKVNAPPRLDEEWEAYCLESGEIREVIYYILNNN